MDRYYIDMGRTIKKGSSCSVCGKNKTTHPGVKLHLLPSDARRRLTWLRALKISYEKNSQAICEDHFEVKYYASKGRLLPHAVPIPVDGHEEQPEQDTCSTYHEYSDDINAPKTTLDTNLISEGSLLNRKCDDNFGKIKDQDSLMPEFSFQFSNLVEEDLLGTDLDGEDCMNHQDLHVTTSSHKEDSLLHADPGGDHAENMSEDTEYSSEDDHVFWEKMKKYARRKGTKPFRNKLFPKYSAQGNNSENEKIKYHPRNSHIKVQKCNDQQSSLTKESNKTSGQVSSVVKGSQKEDDWITDDEVDDDDENIDQAFKREWKEKRLPVNTNEKNFMCEICGKRFAKICNLRVHIVRDHKEHEEAKKYPYSCQHCKRVYIREKQFLQHQQQHRGPCEVCGIMMECSALFWEHRRNHDSVCTICNREFNNNSSLYMHRSLEHVEKKNSCPECDKKFAFESLKKKHIAKVHHNAEQTQYSRDKCNFLAKSQRAVKIHQGLIHGSKLHLFTCKDCERTFKSKLTYKKHVATHVRICPLCSEEFTSESELQTHTISLHGRTDKVDSGKEEVSSHLNSSHVSHYMCTLCNTALADDEDVSQHLYKYHDKDIDTPRDIRVEVQRVHLSEIDGNTKRMVQAVCNDETNGQELDKHTTRNLSIDSDCVSGESALLVPTKSVPPNVNMVVVNGVQYHVIRS